MDWGKLSPFRSLPPRLTRFSPQRWWNRGLGGAAWSQPVREFIVKIVEMSLFAADFLAGVSRAPFPIAEAAEADPPVSSPAPAPLPPHPSLPHPRHRHDALDHALYVHSSFLDLSTVDANLLASLPVWLRPSKQIRSPIFSFKQRALRRKIIFKYGVLYACVFAFFAALIVLPVSRLSRFVFVRRDSALTFFFFPPLARSSLSTPSR